MVVLPVECRLLSKDTDDAVGTDGNDDGVDVFIEGTTGTLCL